MAQMTQARRAADHGEPTNAELLVRIDEVGRQLDAFLAEHRRDPADLDRRMAKHDTDASLRDHNIAHLLTIETEVDGLHDFRVQAQTLSNMVRWIVGGSLVAAIAAIASLLVSIATVAGK